MHRNKIIRFTIASTSAALLLGLAGAPALAGHDGGGGGYDSGSSWSGSYDGGQRGSAASYMV